MGFGGSNQPSLLYLLTNFPVVNMWKAQRDARNESKRRPVDSNSRDHQPTHPFPVEAPLKTPMNSQGTYCTVQSRHPPVSFYRGRRFFRTVGTGMCHRLSCCANVGGTFVRRSPTTRWMMLKKCSTLLSHGVQRSRNCLSKLALLSKKIGATTLAYSALQKRHGGTRRQL